MTEARDHLGRLWTANTYKIGEEPPDDYSYLTAEQRFTLVGELQRRLERLAPSTAGTARQVRESGIPADPLELLVLLVRHEVRFLVVGAHALAVHGLPRYTDDLDVWIDQREDNAIRARAALAEFGAPLDALRITSEDLLNPEMLVQLGLPPNRIDLMSSLSGVASFEAAWAERHTEQIAGMLVPFLGRAELLASKRAAARPQDLLDADRLEAQPRPKR